MTFLEQIHPEELLDSSIDDKVYPHLINLTEEEIICRIEMSLDI